MENINLLSAIVSNNLFPIIACVFMYKQVNEMNKLFNDLSITLKGIDTRLQQIEERQIDIK